MSNWAITCIAVLTAQLLVLVYVYKRMMQGAVLPQDDFADTQPVQVDTEPPAPAAVSQENNVEPAPAPQRKFVSPTLQAAQDNLNYRLWHHLVWLIPNTQWVHTQHQSLSEVQWLCLGPDHRHFIAHAVYTNNEWRWSFIEA